MPIMPNKQNVAAWLPRVGAKLEIGPAPMPEPGHGELLIQVGDDKYVISLGLTFIDQSCSHSTSGI